MSVLTQYFNDTFGRADSATVGNAWLQFGGTGYSIASGKLLASAISLGNELVRPSSEDLLDQQVDADTTDGAFSGGFSVLLRGHAADTGGTSKAGYMVSVAGNQLQAFKLSDTAAYTQLTTPANTVNLPANHTARLRAKAEGVSPTTITAWVFDLTADPTCVSPLATWQIEDNDIALQKPGVAGLTGFGLNNNITAVTIYGTTPKIPVPTALNVPVDSPAFLYSPGTWIGDVGRSGSALRQCWNNGSWMALTWTTTSSSPTAVINAAFNGMMSVVTFVSKNGGSEVAGSSLNLTSLLSGPGTYTARVFLEASTQASRWGATATNMLRLAGATLDTSSTPGNAAALRPWVLMIGDSISEGIAAGPAGANDSATSCYTHLLGERLRATGYDYAVSACGLSGYLKPGDSSGDVPAYYHVTSGSYDETTSRWDKINDGVSFLDTNSHLSAYGATGSEPAAIYINYGTNECLSSLSTSDLTAAITQCMVTLRAAAPSAQIIIQVPFGLYNTAMSNSSGPTYAAAIHAGYNAYTAAHSGDTKTTILDFGQGLSDTLAATGNSTGPHPTQAGHIIVDQTAHSAFLSAIVPASVATTITVSGGGTVAGGSSSQLVAVVRDQFGNVMTGQNVTWTHITGANGAINSTGLASNPTAIVATPQTDVYQAAVGSVTGQATIITEAQESGPVASHATNSTLTVGVDTISLTDSDTSTNPAVVIRYTLDGTDPSATVGTIYTGPITPGAVGTLPVNTVAYRSDRTVSQVSRYTYNVVAQDTTPPTVSSAVLGSSGLVVTVTTSEATTGISGFGVTVGGVSRSITVSRTDSTHLVLTLASVAYTSDNLLLTYSNGNVDDMAGNALATITGAAIANNSTQSAPGGGAGYTLEQIATAVGTYLQTAGGIAVSQLISGGIAVNVSGSGYDDGYGNLRTGVGDEGSVDITIRDSGRALSLAGYTITADMTAYDGTAISTAVACTIPYAEGGVVRYPLQEADTAIGRVGNPSLLRFTLVGPDGKPRKTQAITCTVS